MSGRFLLGATDNGSSGASQAAGNTGGEASHTLTKEEMPSHRHGMQHYHDRGTMNIQGKARVMKVNDESPSSWSGAFTKTDFASNSIGNTGSRYWQWATLNLNASNTGAWTGKTSGSLENSTSGNTTAKTTTDSEGSNNAHNNMPPYLSVYMWKRTA